MEIETRITNLEKRVNYLYDLISRNTFYTEASMAGTRQSVSEITPYKQTKTAYIGDTEIVFDNIPDGNLTVFFNGNYDLERLGGRLKIWFEALEEVTDIAIMVQ